MNPTSSNELPPVANPEHLPRNVGQPASPEGLPQAGSQPLPSVGSSQPDPGTSQGIPPLASLPQAAAAGVTPAAGTPSTADDLDLIEKEWVDKAKEIIARTQGNPYEQNKEVTLMKVDYLNKRYGKAIKVDDK